MSYFYFPLFSDVRSCHVFPWWVSKQLPSIMIFYPLCSHHSGSPLASPMLVEFQTVKLCRFPWRDHVLFCFALFFLEDTETIKSLALLLLDRGIRGTCVKKDLICLPEVKGRWLSKGRIVAENVPLLLSCTLTSRCESKPGEKSTQAEVQKKAEALQCDPLIICKSADIWPWYNIELADLWACKYFCFLIFFFFKV